MRWAAAAAGLLVGIGLAGCGGPSAPVPVPEPSTDLLLARRAVHTATPLGDGTVLVAGGCDVDGCSTATRSAMLLGPDGARPTAHLSHPRDGHVGVRLPDGRVLVVGGYTGEGQPPLATAEVFDPVAGRWQAVGALRFRRGGHDAVVLGHRRVLVVGGWLGPGTPTATTEIFDPATGRFTSGPELPRPVDGLAATALADGSVLVTGGQIGPGAASSAATLVAADGRSARPVGPLAVARFKHAAVALPDGTALILGGTSDDRTLLDTTEIFDPRSGTFRPGPTMVHGRYKLAGGTAVLPDGRVAVAGGGPGLEVITPGGQSSLVAGATGLVASFSTLSVVGQELWLVGGYDRQIRLTGRVLRLPLADI